MFFDGSLMKTGAGAGLLFISPLGKHLRYVLCLHFPASNNVAEYEALVNGLRIAIELGVRRLDARGDSQLVIDQVMKNSHCRDSKMEAYCDEVRRLEDKFYGLELNHIARCYETADELAKIASGQTTVPLDVFSRDLHQPSVKIDDTPEPEAPSAQPEVPSAQSEVPSARPEAPSAWPEASSVQPEVPSAPEGEALRVEEERSGVTPNQNWQTPYLQYLHRGELPLDRWEGALPPQPLRYPPAMHFNHRRSGTPTRDTLEGLRPSRGTSSPCRKRLPARFLLADGGGRRR
jgi:ribonuclease HI